MGYGVFRNSNVGVNNKLSARSTRNIYIGFNCCV